MNTALPVIAQPSFEITIPSTGKKVYSRPMISKERKILLIALQDGATSSISLAIRGLVSACVTDVKYDNLTPFDVEWIFLQLVINSIRDTLDLEVTIPGREDKCKDCSRKRLIRVNLKDIVVDQVRKKKDMTLKINDDISLKLKYATEKDLEDLDLISSGKSEFEKMTDLISISIESVSDTDGVKKFSDYTHEQKVEFLDNLPPLVTDQLDDFVSTIPRVGMDVKIVCQTCSFEASTRLEGLEDFFV